MPTGFAAHPCRRPIVLIATCLVVVQALLAGVAAAQAAAMLASGPADAICHGSGAPGPGDATGPEPAKVRHLCCAYCMAAAPGIAPPVVPSVAQAPQASRPVARSSFTVIIARGAIRAGLSQAPPSLA